MVGKYSHDNGVFHQIVNSADSVAYLLKDKTLVREKEKPPSLAKAAQGYVATSTCQHCRLSVVIMILPEHTDALSKTVSAKNLHSAR